MTRRIAAALALLLCAVARAEETAPDDPAALVQRLEARLIAARHVAIEATIESDGLINAKLKGKSELQDRNRATIAYRGEFGGKTAELKLSSDGRALELHGSDQLRREAVGKESNRALLVGFVRLGLLHNLARLGAAQAPDHGAGGADEWAVLDAFRPTTYAQSGDLEGAMSFGFDVLEAGEVVGSVRLWLDPATGLPRRRAVTYLSPQGETHAVEDYTRFVVE